VAGATLLSLAALAALAAAHVLGGGLRFLDRTPRSRWLSVGAGVSVAYVFAHLLPELATAQREVEESAEGVLPFVEDHVYLVALGGFLLFYGVEITGPRPTADDEPGPAAFWLSMGSYAVYNAVIGYLIVQREDGGGTDLALFALALALHFVVNDFGLRQRHQRAYARVGRWLLVSALAGGWAVGRLAELEDPALGLLVAFLAGGVVLNAIKDELPGERQGRFGAFAAAAIAYGALLQAV
jgi:hypothetical protein